MANVKKILSEESINGALKAGWNINQLNTVAQMCFDEAHTGTHGPVEPFTSVDAGINHILHHVITINGRNVSELTREELLWIINNKRVIAHDAHNAQVVSNQDEGFGLRRYYPEGESSPFLIEECYKAIWEEFDESWKFNEEPGFPYTDLKPEIKHAVFNQLNTLINVIYDYMNK